MLCRRRSDCRCVSHLEATESRVSRSRETAAANMFKGVCVLSSTSRGVDSKLVEVPSEKKPPLTLKYNPPADAHPADRPGIPQRTLRSKAKVLPVKANVEKGLHTLSTLSRMVEGRLPSDKRQQAVRRAGDYRADRGHLRTGTPDAPQGRIHSQVQTELYLQELAKVIVTADVQSQTDPLQDRPASPLFVPAKTGKDVATHIEDGELFDFDMEVEPVLEVLVGKTIEQSLLEVMEEEELACLRAQQRSFEVIRNQQVAEVQRLAEQERRYMEEKARRIAEQKEAVRKEMETAEKIAAQAYTRQYLASLVPAVFRSLTDHGYFYDPVEREIEAHFFPWLRGEVNNILKKRSTARHTLDMAIDDVSRERRDAYKELEPESPFSDT